MWKNGPYLLQIGWMIKKISSKDPPTPKIKAYLISWNRCCYMSSKILRLTYHKDCLTLRASNTEICLKAWTRLRPTRKLRKKMEIIENEVIVEVQPNRNHWNEISWADLQLLNSIYPEEYNHLITQETSLPCTANYFYDLYNIWTVIKTLILTL